MYQVLQLLQPYFIAALVVVSICLKVWWIRHMFARRKMKMAAAPLIEAAKSIIS